jgi:hypothetical protein
VVVSNHPSNENKRSRGREPHATDFIRIGPKHILSRVVPDRPVRIKALQNESVQSRLRIGPLENRISDSTRSSPPKNGCTAMSPRSFTLLNLYSPALTATWWARFPLALSPARKQRLRSALAGRSCPSISSMNFSASNLSPYWHGN